MALLRAVEVPCWIHSFTIDKTLQQGAMTGLIYRLAPQNVIHSWVEVFYNEKWFNLEGYILDAMYIKQLQDKFKDCNGGFFAYGVFDTPDEFFAQHAQEISLIKKFAYQKIGRHRMNQNVNRIRRK